MEKHEHQIDTPTTTNWTIREELLLSYAVKRHGFNDWDTVAVEIQSRSSLPQIFTSPHHCKLKYLELKRRFLQINNNDKGNDEIDVDADVAVPWLEDLRNLRVEELRREVHRYDDSILNLQMKVKKLEEERERSVEMIGNEDVEKPDLQKVNDENGSENDKNEHDGGVTVVDNKSPEILAGESITGENTDQEKQQSVNESNSTGPKDENNQQTGLNDDTITNKVEELDRSVSTKPDSVIKVVKSTAGDNSCDESSDSVAKRLGLTPEEKENKPESNTNNNNNNNNNSTESRNSESDYNRVNMERSDVQSSASLTVKSRQSSGGAGDESVERSFGAMKQISVKSQPLAKIMELIRSHKRGSLFERRLDSQASDKYKNVVRQHMDLQKIKKRLDQGSYSSCASKFYRDLLLLFNNAIVYFPKSSAEFVAATELQKVVVSEMSKQTQRSDYSPEPSLTPHSQAQSKPDPEKPESLLDSHKSSAPIIVCRKRSSISSKSDSNKTRGLENEEKKTSTEVKPASGNSNTHVVEEQQSPLNNTDTKDRIITGTRSFRRSNSSLTTSAAPLKKQSNTSTDIVKKVTPKIEKNTKKEKEKEQEKEKELLPLVKKRGAADFLKRIKGNSPLDKSKSTANDTKSTRQNNNTGKKFDSNDGRKEKIILRQKPATKEDTSSSKRNAGGTVKKPVESVPVKRKKEPETSSSKRPPQKRNRR